MTTKEKIVWECASCGLTQPKWTGSCTRCHEWNTFVEKARMESKNTKYLSKSSNQKPILLADVDLTKFYRIKTHFEQLDELLGGGLVIGGLFLIAGNPGIGKSTLLLQLAALLAKQNKKILYVCAEESTEQTSMRAKRLNLAGNNLYLLNETAFHLIKEQVDNLKPDMLIIDSIQTLYKEDMPSAAGSVTQVREIANEFLHLSKSKQITTFLVGHVTKSGEIAGPRVLEHIVDVVLDFEGDSQHGFRFLRSRKNRFGPTDEMVLFHMQETGLKEIKNPSHALLEDRQKNLAGMTIVPTVDGKRSLLVELQALVSSTVYPTPARKSVGLEANRLALLLAVLEKKVGYHFYKYDVFVSVAGGIRIFETGIDLGIILAIASSIANQPLPNDLICFGEVGLGGELRKVMHAESRIKEAISLGFTKCVLPSNTYKTLSSKYKNKLDFVPVNLVDEAIKFLI